MEHSPARLVRIFLPLLAACMILGCELKSQPIDIGPPAPRPKMGLQLKVVEGRLYMKEPLLDEFDRALLVMEAKPGGPAGKAGVLPGDLLMKIDGQKVHGMQDSVYIMHRKRPGDSLILDLYRNHETLQLGVDLDSGGPKE